VSPQFCIILKILGTNLAFAVFVGFNRKVLGFVVNLGTVYGGKYVLAIKAFDIVIF
jgi:hypothetical protein